MILKVLQFDDYKDFYKRCEELKKSYDLFYITFKKTDEVFKYRDYVYSKDIQELEKNAIWDYLNDYLPREYLRSKIKNVKKRSFRR